MAACFVNDICSTQYNETTSPRINRVTTPKTNSLRLLVHVEGNQGDSSFRDKITNTSTITKSCEPALIKGIENGCPCIVEIRGTQGCALVGDPARAVGECRDVAKAQP